MITKKWQKLLTVKNDNICTYFVLLFMLSFLRYYHLCYHLMFSFFTVSKCYHFYVIIFPCTYFVLSFMLSFDVIISCYHFPPFFFFLKTWHTPKFSTFQRMICYFSPKISTFDCFNIMVFQKNKSAMKHKHNLGGNAFVLSRHEKNVFFQGIFCHFWCIVFLTKCIKISPRP